MFNKWIKNTIWLSSLAILIMSLKYLNLLFILISFALKFYKGPSLSFNNVDKILNQIVINGINKNQ